MMEVSPTDPTERAPSADEVETAKPDRRSRLRPGTVIGLFLVAAVASNLLARQLQSEPYFPDESALLGQSYYFELYRGHAVTEGDSAWNHVDWIRYPAYDHPPLVKYLAGLSLLLAGEPIPQDASRIMAWYRGDWTEPAADTLFQLRLPGVVFGVLACLMVYFLGVRIRSRLVGIVAGCAVAVNPLFYTLSRRALFDVPAEACVLATVALVLACWPRLVAPTVDWRAWVGVILGGGALAAFATLSKLNGAIAIVLLAALIVLAISAAGLQRIVGLSDRAPTDGDDEKAIAPQGPAGDRHGIATGNLVLAPFALVGAGGVSLIVMLALNPFLTAVPSLAALPSGDYNARKIRDLSLFQRLAFQFQFRLDWSRTALASEQFRDQRLPNLPSRIRAVFWQGFGRYGPLGKRRPGWHAEMRDPETGTKLEHLLPRTWPAVFWFPLCAAGFLWLLGDGWKQARDGRAPIAWGAALYMAAVAAAVTITVPLTWDRYFLPLVPAGTLAATYALVRTLVWLGSRFVLEPPKPEGNSDSKGRSV